MIETTVVKLVYVKLGVRTVERGEGHDSASNREDDIGDGHGENDQALDRDGRRQAGCQAVKVQSMGNLCLNSEGRLLELLRVHARSK